MSKETSSEISSMAGRILAGGNPLDNEQVALAISNALFARVQSMTENRESMAHMPAVVIEAIRPVLAPYFENMLSLAGSCLSQDETRGN